VLTANFAQICPVEAGLNTTLIVQVDPIARDAPQVLVCENWLADAPVNAMLVKGSTVLPVFCTVTDCAALEVFVFTLPNASDVGDNVKGTKPVPLTVAVCVVPGPPLTFNVAV
jgi:hypothetical protein